jgi:ABC-type branched-subunit amino acid transport system substrate-binding protein
VAGLGITLAAALAACDTASPAATGPTRVSDTDSPSPLLKETVKVAFIQDLSPEGALDRTLSAFQAIELAFSNEALDDDASVTTELVAFDVAGDPAAAEVAAADIAADPAYVAAFAAPYLGGQRTLARALGNVPMFSLSASGRAPDGEPGRWLRFVAPVRDQADALANLAISRPQSRRGMCLSPAPVEPGLDRALTRALEHEIDVNDALDAADVLGSRCGVVVWAGDGLGGARLALALDGSGIAIVGGSGFLDPDFLEDAGVSAEGVVSSCSCADVSTSLDLAAQRFIQDYQSEYGSPPGPFAVEAWDAAHMLLRTLREPTPSRNAVADSIAETSLFDGLGGAYRFEGGELARPGASIRIYRVDGGRWILVEAAGETRGGASQA